MKKILTVILLLLQAMAFAAIPQKPDPPRLVNDFAGVFSQMQVNELERILVDFDDSTSNQIAVITLNDIEGADPDEYAVRIGLGWGVGGSGYNNGVVVLIVPKTDDRRGQVSIQVGYGLEGAIPDIYCKRIIEQEMIPRFRENDYYGAVRAATSTLMKLASGEISEVREKDGEELSGFVIAFYFIIFLLGFALALKYGKSGNGGNNSGGGGGVYMGPIITPRSRYGGFGGGFGGGSFGGGGGFGGFGGGSFGGGGASGSW